MKYRLPLICLLPSALLLATGCGPTAAERRAHDAVADYHYGQYARAVETLRPVAEKPDENFVLNNARLGSAALAEYDLRTAEEAFLNAYEVINQTGTNSGGRGAAAAIFSEKMKVWKGEPFEKAMVNFYLGVVYYMRHDYENARAAFENSLFKLRDYGESGNGTREDEYRRIESDFVIGYVMLGRCYARMGDEANARKYLDRAAELRPTLRGLVNVRQNVESNVLLVVDFGQGPRRVTNRYDGAFVGFGPNPQQVGPIPSPRVLVDGAPVTGPRGEPAPFAPPIDLLALAQEKRWQDIDTIRAVKDVVGTGMIAAGAYEANRASYERGSSQRRDGTAAAALIGAGLLLKASAQADTRTWEMLPRTTYLIPLRLVPRRHDVTVDFPAEFGLAQTWRGIVAPATGDATYYVRIQPRTSGVHVWPPPALAERGPSPAPGGAPPTPRPPAPPAAGTPAPKPADRTYIY